MDHSWVIHDPIISLVSICHSWFFQIPNLRVGEWSRGKRCCRHRGDGLLLPYQASSADGGLEDFKLEEEENCCGWMSSWIGDAWGDWSLKYCNLTTTLHTFNYCQWFFKFFCQLYLGKVLHPSKKPSYTFEPALWWPCEDGMYQIGLDFFAFFPI